MVTDASVSLREDTRSPRIRERTRRRALCAPLGCAGDYVDIVALVLASLATYRLARMVASEEGPGGVFVKLRGVLDADQQTWFGRGMNCQLCVGFWLALP